MEIKYHLVSSRFYIQGTQDIIHSAQFCRLSVYRSRPTRIIYFREHDDTTLVGSNLISQIIWLILSQLNNRSIILRHTFTELLLELRISYSFMSQIDLSYLINLLIGIFCIAYLINKPSIAIGIKILHRHSLSTLQRHDEVLRVEHIEHREYAVAIHLRHVTTSLSYSLHRLLHLWRDISIYHLRITTEFGWMITTNALMII